MKWNLKWLIIWHLVVLVLLTSFFSSTGATLWQTLDIACFRALNHTLEGNLFAQKFWAWMNLRAADWLEDIVFLSFFIVYIRSCAKELRTRKICALILCVAYCGAIVALNKATFRSWIHIERLSPSLVLDHVVDVSHALFWTSVKTASASSFPGDHGITALFFPVVLSWLGATRKLQLSAWIYTAFLSIPRMIVGAHWLSDVAVGSASIVLVFSSWWFCSPLFTQISLFLEKCVLGCRKLIKKVAL